MEFAGPAEIRGKGLAIGVVVGDEDYADKIVKRCRERGVLIASTGDALQILPALTLEERLATKALDVIERCL